MWDAQFEKIVRPFLTFLPDDAPFTDDLPLRDHGLDSLGIVSLLMDLEGNYDIKFTDDALAIESFETPRSLWQVVSGLTAA